MYFQRASEPERCSCRGESGDVVRVGSEWSGWSGRIAHPDSPVGGGGPGHFSRMPLGQRDSDLPSPWSPRPAPAMPLEGQPVPAPTKRAPVTVAKQLGVLKHIQDALFDVHVEAEIVADGGAAPSVGAETSFKGGGQFTSPKATTADKKVTSFTSKFTWKGTIRIQTAYASNADSNHVSCYGRGTTDEDVKARTITLGFHESCHRDDYERYLAANALPDPPKFAVGMTIDEYKQAHAGFDSAIKAYFAKMASESIARTDEVGFPLSMRKATKKCFQHTVP
jgi:hypothetical protein